MCTPDCIDFVRRALEDEDLSECDVLEAGSYDVNGSARSLIEPRCYTYCGIDIEEGPGVDEVVPAENLIEHGWLCAFSVVITTEMLEHVEDWRAVINNLKRATSHGGLIVITTRSIGFGYHGYPSDFWRYEKSDMEAIFADWEILMLEDDPGEKIHPSFRGVFVKARKPSTPYEEVDLSTINLYAMEQPPADGRILCQCGEELEEVHLLTQHAGVGTMSNFMGHTHKESRSDRCANGGYAMPRKSL